MGHIQTIEPAKLVWQEAPLQEDVGQSWHASAFGISGFYTILSSIRGYRWKVLQDDQTSAPYLTFEEAAEAAQEDMKARLYSEIASAQSIS